MAYVTMGDGGGGSTDYSTLLDMKSVLDDGTTEQSTRVLYADIINKEAVSTLLDQLIDLSNEGGLAAESSTLIANNDSMMSQTNSDRFYNGDEAKLQFQNMSDVNTKIQALLGSIDKIDKGAILSKIDQYNTRLMELKTDCRMELLRKAADSWNRAKHEKEGFPKSYSGMRSAPSKVTEWGWHEDRVVFKEATDINWYDIPIPTNQIYGRVSQNEFKRCSYKWHEYKIIQYWHGFRNVFKFWDPGFEEVEQMFADAGAPLPYDPAKILPKA